MKEVTLRKKKKIANSDSKVSSWSNSYADEDPLKNSHKRHHVGTAQI